MIEKLDPEWKEWPDGVVTGKGQAVNYKILGPLPYEQTFAVTLMHHGGAIYISKHFASLRSAKRWCETYFG